MKYQNNLDSIVKGLNDAADIITSTMGGKGKTVAINSDDNLKFTKDGVSVAREIKFINPFENIGAKILISSANETVNKVGDGTTLTSLLLQQFINNVDLDSNDIKEDLKELKEAIDKVIDEIKVQKKDINSIDEIKAIATVSANSDEIGTLFANLYEEASFDSLIKLEHSQYNSESYFEVLKGIEYRNGYIHPSFRTNDEIEQAVYEDALVVLSKKPITSINDKFSQMIGAAHENETPIVIMAPSFSDAFKRRATMVKVNQGVQVCLVKLPGESDHAKNKNFDDIQSFLSEDGYVDRIVITPYTTTMYNEDTPNLEKRINTLRALKDNAVEWWEEKDYEDRLHKLKGSSAIIYAGGRTKEERSEEYDRIEDAIGATKSAIRNGYVPGAGYTMFNIETDNKVLKEALKAPLFKILENANCNIGLKTIMSKVGKEGYLFNVKTDVWEKAEDTNVIDPADVLIEALNNAYSNTKLIVNTSFIINK